MKWRWIGHTLRRMLQDKPGTISHMERGKLDGWGTTGSVLCCRSWKEWASPERESKHWQRTEHVGGYGWTPYAPPGVIKDNEDEFLSTSLSTNVLANGQIIPAVLSNLASWGWHLLLIISSHLFPWAGFRWHTILPLQWCLRVPSADRVNCMNGWSQGFDLVSTRIVPSGGWHFPLWGLIHIPLACRRGVGAEGCAASQQWKKFVDKIKVQSNLP